MRWRFSAWMWAPRAGKNHVDKEAAPAILVTLLFATILVFFFVLLRRLVAPYILRRLKTDRTIIADLPDKVEPVRYCNLTKAQIRLYEQVVTTMKTTLENVDGLQRRALVLQTLMRLKQVCNHPSQLTNDGAYTPAESGKFLRVAEICEEVAERQQRALIFTQFREIIDFLADHLNDVFGRGGLTLHGGTNVAKRKGLVEQFQREDGSPFMILSLKAGGTGFNLTAVSHVIHFDRWWNPAVEDQATDRAFRIGQRKDVLVHKFVTSGSVEEKIDQMIAEKRQLATELLTGGGEVDLSALSDNELMDLVRLDIRRAAVEASKDVLADGGLAEIFGIDIETGASRCGEEYPQEKTVVTVQPLKRAKPSKTSKESKATRSTEKRTSAPDKGTKRKPKRSAATKKLAPFDPKASTGAAIARLRKKTGRSVTDFARSLGVTIASVQRWEDTPGPLRIYARPLTALTQMQKEHSGL